MASRFHIWAAFEALAVLSLVSSSAVADEKLGWHGDNWEQNATFYYGIPESDYAPLSFSCQQGTREIMFSFTSAPDNAFEGAKVDVLLQVGNAELRILTTASWSDMDESFVLEGPTVLDERFTDLITSGGTLIVSSNGMKGEIPMTGAREAAGALIETCKG